MGQTWRVDGAGITLVFNAVAHHNIDLSYLGPSLSEDEDLTALAKAAEFGKHENQLDEPSVRGLFPQSRCGYREQPSFRLSKDGQPVSANFHLTDVESDDGTISFIWEEQSTGLYLDITFEILTGDVIVIHQNLMADGAAGLTIQQVSPLSIPLPKSFNSLTSYAGRWAREMQAADHPIGREAIEMRSIGGKPGFDPGNWLFLKSDGEDQNIGAHCGSLEDHITRCGRDEDGQPFLSLEHLLPQTGLSLGGEEDFVELATMTLMLADSADDLTRKFHDHARTNILPSRPSWGPRKVHLNSWEALVFDLDEAKLRALASDAAELGVERFVLDDGWFKGRRSDKSALGDWDVDRDIFPNGLKPLIDHVHSLDMDFGLWIEPEMISPDSDLYRAHPDWCLHDGAPHRPTERNQLVLDLTREQTFDHIYNAICKLLDENDIAYIKWDHNRRLPPTSNPQGYAAWRLKAAIRQKYPNLEIESCASGGGQICYPVLRNSHRVWPSDNNDPIERLRIMQSWARFLPLEILGNHVGPSPNPITGRRTDMDFRSKVALFGHMGVEANPADMSADERDVLKQHIALYKVWRDVLHGGEFWQLDHAEPSIFWQMVVRGDRAIAFAAQTQFAPDFNVAPIRLKGLQANANYRIKMAKPWPQKASQYLANPTPMEFGMILSGQALMENGLALPLTHPETAWIITLERV